jgi:hypothetical protein
MPFAIPELAGIVILFSLFALYIALLGLNYGYSYTIGAVLRGLFLALNFSLLGHKISLGGPFDSLDHWIRGKIATGLDSVETTMGRFYHELGDLTRATYETLAWFAETSAQALHNLTHSTIPGLIDGKVAPVRTRTEKAAKAQDARTRREARTRAAGIEAGVRDLRAEQLARQRGIDRINKAELPRIRARVKADEGIISRERAYAHRVLNKRLSLLERLLGVGAIGGIAAAVLTRLFPYWQCSNVRRFNKNLCRSPLGSLDWLFGLAGAATLVLDPNEVIKVGTEVEHLMDRAFREMGKL